MFASSSKSRISLLRATLKNTKKKEMTADKYLTKMNGFRYELSDAGKIIDDKEMVRYIVNGLDGAYNAMVEIVYAALIFPLMMSRIK
jgi:hypothetical protein